MVDYRKIIRGRRLEKGISQNKLAKMVGITQPFMTEIERGRKNPSVEILFKICAELDIQLFAEAEPKE